MQRFAVCLRLIDKGTNIKTEITNIKNKIL